MIIRRIKMAPFGGVKNTELIFAPGLNVVLGPNEAGKSTLVNALFAALFLKSGLHKSSPDWKDYMLRFMPHGGGDTIGVDVEFTCRQGKAHTLSRRWGHKKDDCLQLPDGNVIHEEAQIRSVLDAVLVHGRGTYEGVLFARQEEMIRTVEALKANKEAFGTLSEILRGVIFQTGGVSLDQLAEVLAKEKNTLLNLWDTERDGPKDNRGIERPFVKGCGQVLLAYYEAEWCKRALQAATAAQVRVDDLKSQLQTLQQEKQQIDGQKAVLEKIEGDIRQRAMHEPKLEALAAQEKALKLVNVQWPQMVEKLKGFAGEQERLALRKVALATELAETSAVLAARLQRETHNRVAPLVSETSEVAKKMQKMRAVRAADVDWLVQQLTAVTQHQAVLEAMKLKAKITVRQPLSLKVTSGLDKQESVTVTNDASFAGEGRLVVECPDWTLEVQSGQADVGLILAKMQALQADYQEKLSTLGVEHLEEARGVVAERSSLQTRLEHLQTHIGAQLQGLDFAALVADVAALPPDKPVREITAIVTENAGIEAEAGSLTEKMADLKSQIDKWVEEYSEHEKVMDCLADVRFEVRQSQDKLQGLAALPDVYATAEAFLRGLQQLRNDSSQVDNKVFAVKLKLVEAEGALPEESPEEIAEKLAVAKKQWERVQKRAQAVSVAEATFQQLAQKLDLHTFDPFVQAFTRYLAPATGHRYRAAALAGAIPRTIVHIDGGELPVHLLSTGTTRGIALALRLAMAEYFLGDVGGFMVMDDPLVDLDPERKRYAAAMVSDYAKDKQLIIATCDPETAHLLGGYRIELKK